MQMPVNTIIRNEEIKAASFACRTSDTRAVIDAKHCENLLSIMERVVVDRHLRNLHQNPLKILVHAGTRLTILGNDEPIGELFRKHFKILREVMPDNITVKGSSKEAITEKTTTCLLLLLRSPTFQRSLQTERGRKVILDGLKAMTGTELDLGKVGKRSLEIWLRVLEDHDLSDHALGEAYLLSKHKEVLKRCLKTDEVPSDEDAKSLVETFEAVADLPILLEADPKAAHKLLQGIARVYYWSEEQRPAIDRVLSSSLFAIRPYLKEDVIIQTDDAKVSTNALVLARLPMLKQLLTGAMRDHAVFHQLAAQNDEAPLIALPNVTAEILQMLFDYLGNGEFSSGEINGVDLMLLADRLGLDDPDFYQVIGEALIQSKSIDLSELHEGGLDRIMFLTEPNIYESYRNLADMGDKQLFALLKCAASNNDDLVLKAVGDQICHRVNHWLVSENKERLKDLFLNQKLIPRFIRITTAGLTMPQQEWVKHMTKIKK